VIDVADLAVNGLRPDQNGVVTTFGGRRHTLTGGVSGGVPRGFQLWVVTNPPTNKNTYLQGRIEPAPDGRWSVNVNVGRVDDQYYDAPDPVTIILVSDDIGSFLVRCGGSDETSPVVPADIPREDVAHLSIYKKKR
jgi:hypothetical protein